MLEGKKREYYRLATRFLKEIGLYGYWKQFINDSQSHLTWLYHNDISAQDIFGKTNFTEYVMHRRGYNTDNIKGYYLYEIYGEYLVKMYRNTYGRSVFDQSYDMLHIDVKKKIVKPNWTI